MAVRAIGKNLPEVKKKKDNITIKKNAGEISWNSSASQPIKKLPCVVPVALIHIMRQIERDKFTGSPLEFGLYLKGKIEDGVLHVKSEVMLPPQEVTSTSINFDGKQDGGDEFNGVIHRHPGALHSFSGTDETYINSNFMFSLLYASKEIKTGIVNVPTEFGRIRLDLDITVDTPEIDISYLNLDNIKEREIVTTVRKAPSDPYAGWKNNNWQGHGSNWHQNDTRREPVIANGFRGSVSEGIYTPSSFENDNDDKEDESTASFSPEEITKLNKELADYELNWASLEIYAESQGCFPSEIFERLTGFSIYDVIEEEVKIDEEGFPYIYTD